MNGFETRGHAIEGSPLRLSPPQGSGSVHLDALRGVAAFLVLLLHWREAFFQDYEKVSHHSVILSLAYTVTGLSHQAVMMFFVLSGYLVGGSVLRAVQAGRWSWRDYMLARLTRLYIVLLPALVLGAVLDWAGTHLTGQDAVYGANGRAGTIELNVSPSLTARTFLENAIFMQSLPVPGKPGRAFPTFGSNIPLWSLSFEFWYYVAFPCAVLALAHKRSWYLRLIYLGLLLIWGWFVGLNVVLYSIPWLLGVAIRSLPPFPAQRLWVQRGAMTLALIAMILSFIGVKTGPAWVQDTLFGECTAALIWIAAGGTTRPTSGWFSRVAHGAAKNSYTLYLVHLPFLVFLKATLHVPQFMPSWFALLPALGLMALILGYARVVYLLFERHTDELRGWLKKHLAGRRTTTEAFSQTAN
jgi:peptidoglycan/LPS O-acetylase OafA/YrhL